jgi:hypothetical protein
MIADVFSTRLDNAVSLLFPNVPCKLTSRFIPEKPGLSNIFYRVANIGEYRFRARKSRYLGSDCTVKWAYPSGTTAQSLQPTHDLVKMGVWERDYGWKGITRLLDKKLCGLGYFPKLGGLVGWGWVDMPPASRDRRRPRDSWANPSTSLSSNSKPGQVALALPLHPKARHHVDRDRSIPDSSGTPRRRDHRDGERAARHGGGGGDGVGERRDPPTKKAQASCLGS